MENRRLLIVDDDPAIAELLGEFCREMGHDVRVVTDSRSALAAAIEFRPHLVTLDLDMPHMNGVDVLNQLRAHPATDRTAVVIISVCAKDAGLAVDLVKGCLDKPVVYRVLEEKLRGVLKASE